jgi:hypothetical protein
MRKFSLTAILIVVTTVVCWSQKTINKTFDVAGKKLELKFDFADSIRIETWNKSTVELQVVVDIESNKYNDYYSLNANQFSGEARVVEKVDFEGLKKAKGCKNNCNFNTSIFYTVKVPASVQFSLKTISGEVTLVGALENATINSISGFIDYAVPSNLKARINLSTVTGDVYSNIKFDNKVGKEMSWVGTKQDLVLNSGTSPIHLQTVSGNIYLRKAKQ